jgi:hypothetical protein
MERTTEATGNAARHFKRTATDVPLCSEDVADERAGKRFLGEADTGTTSMEGGGVELPGEC